MILDSHIHIHYKQDDNRTIDEIRTDYLNALAEAGIDGSMVMSAKPRSFGWVSQEQKLEDVIEFCKGYDNLYPFFRLDPSLDNSMEMIEKADAAGVMGFKIICEDFYPHDERVMSACRRIAELKKPVLFHSGILWNGIDSARYNRPGEYECLLEVPGLKFCLAHVSWPWTDECIAVYGKFNNAHLQRPDLSCEMFVDIAPGTPAIYRREVLMRLFCSDYQAEYNVMFGTDCNNLKYNVAWAKEWMARDKEILKECFPDKYDDVIDHVYCKNFLRFIGKSDEKIDRIYPDVAV